MRSARVFHFVFGLRPQHEPFHLAHYLCLASCLRVNRPDAIHFHCRHRPHGPWWDRIAPHLVLREVGAVHDGFAPERYADHDEGRFIARAGLSYAHEADFVRLDVLAGEGGVYADIDTLFVRPYPDRWFAHPCVLGEEPATIGRNGVLRPSLCNAVILARPGAPFLQRWRDGAAAAFDGTWSRHSCEEAARLWRASPEDVHVLPRRALYRFGVDAPSFVSLFEQRCHDLHGVYSIHLWSHLWWSESRTDFTEFHAGLLTERYVREADTTYAALARTFLDAG